jgi:hypothetical protein
MKKPYLFFLLSLFITSCSLTHYNYRLSSQYDQIKKEKRVNLKMVFFKTEERYTSFISSEINFFKTINASGEANVSVYNQLYLSTGSYPLSDTIYLLVGKQVFPIKVKFQNREVFRHMQTQTREIMKADSTTETVISGIHENEYRHLQFHYSLSNQEINALKNTKTAAIRYYANPETYTLKFSGQSLHKLKKFFAMQ